MTDGIIQQVFGKQIKLLASDIGNILMLYELQQELIEKTILLWIESRPLTNDKAMHRTLLINLIGDSQE